MLKSMHHIQKTSGVNFESEVFLIYLDYCVILKPH